MKTKEKKGNALMELARVAIEQSKIGSSAPTYVGVCIVQATGAWSRVGPTWVVPGIGWLVVGPGLRTWGTTDGLAQFGADMKTTPTWHANGVSFAPLPNIVFAVLPAIVEHHEKLREIDAAVREALS